MDSLYESPLKQRYASKEMLAIFSDNFKYSTWRKLWIALAESEKELGLPITQEQIAELKEHISDIDYEVVKKHEQRLQHDVMAHLHAFADLCPTAAPILHLGATSAYLTDNGDLLQFQAALMLIEKKLNRLIHAFTQFADKYKALPCLAYTHFQPAQPTTVGKRACLWLQDFLLDLSDLKFQQGRLSFLGLKGASGTQSSFLTLFNEDANKVKQLEQRIAKKLGFTTILPISGQTYTRKQDVHLFNVLSGIAISSHKCATDLRLLAHLRELAEPFESSQVGSSAMPHKRNPILCERVCALSRFALSLGENGAYTAATQWLERSLDDSANRRLSIPEAFLTIDAVLDLMNYIIDHLEVFDKVIAKHLKEELPFLLTEELLMQAVKKGGDRQELHHRLLGYCKAAAGCSDALLELIAQDSAFDLTVLVENTALVGRSDAQVTEFLKGILL